MSITKDDVKNLRRTTGANIKDCKQALEKSNGNIEAAMAILIGKGVRTGSKKELEKMVFSHIDGSRGILFGIKCESSDKLKSSEKFSEMLEGLAQIIFEEKPKYLNKKSISPKVRRDREKKYKNASGSKKISQQDIKKYMNNWISKVCFMKMKMKDGTCVKEYISQTRKALKTDFKLKGFKIFDMS